MTKNKINISDCTLSFGDVGFKLEVYIEKIQAFGHFLIKEKDLVEFKDTVESLLNKSELKEYYFPTDKLDSDSYIKVVKNDNLGHFSLLAQLGNSWDDNLVKVKIEIDQTELREIIKSIFSYTRLN